MENPTTYITIQEVAKIFKCTTRTVYRKLDAIGSIGELVDNGFATIEYSENGNNRRLFNESWIREMSKRQQRVKNVKNSDKSDWIKVVENQLNTKDDQIKDLLTQLSIAQETIADFKEHFHLNNMENSPRLTTTKQSLESNDNKALSVDINELKDSEKPYSEWLKQYGNK